jgi:membrane protein implicated in regulation of membrane protease activity
MGEWVVWLVAAGLLAWGELHTGALYLAPFAAGALLAGAISVVGIGTGGAAVVFAGGSLLALGALRPVARRHRTMPPAIRTGVAALVGKPAMVLERIANREGVGSVKIDGEVWTARSYDEDDVIDSGERVEVVEIRGATALVVR